MEMRYGNTEEKMRMDAIFVTRSECEDDDFKVDFEIIPIADNSREIDARKTEIQDSLRDIDTQLSILEDKLEELNSEVDKLTNHADGVDYAIAVTCGILTGIFDSIFVGEWDFREAKARSNKSINEKVMDFAKKDSDYQKFLDNKRTNNNPDRLDNAIEFLEKKYKLPGDGAYKDYKTMGVTDASHHLDDFCHHPTLIGLVCCILVQFTGSATYRSSTGAVIKTPIEINEYGKVVSDDTFGKFFAGVVNWFFNVAQTMKNRKGHLYSDMAGSSTSVGKGNAGTV